MTFQPVFRSVHNARELSLSLRQKLFTEQLCEYRPKKIFICRAALRIMAQKSLICRTALRITAQKCQICRAALRITANCNFISRAALQITTSGTFKPTLVKKYDSHSAHALFCYVNHTFLALYRGRLVPLPRCCIGNSIYYTYGIDMKEHKATM